MLEVIRYNVSTHCFYKSSLSRMTNYIARPSLLIKGQRGMEGSVWLVAADRSMWSGFYLSAGLPPSADSAAVNQMRHSWRKHHFWLCRGCQGFRPPNEYSVVKNPPAMQETGFDSWDGKIPWSREWQPTPVIVPGESHGERSLVSPSPWSRKEPDTTGWLYHSNERYRRGWPSVLGLLLDQRLWHDDCPPGQGWGSERHSLRFRWCAAEQFSSSSCFWHVTGSPDVEFI